MTDPSWDEGTETRFEDRSRDIQVVYEVTLYCEDGEEGIPEPEELSNVLLPLEGVVEVRVKRH